jgi:aspartate/methionine/tyrosine aminotransferase
MTASEGSMFALPKVEATDGTVWKDDVDFLVDLIKEEDITFVPGSNYYSPGHFRVGLLTSDKDLEEGFDRIERFIKKRCARDF